MADGILQIKTPAQVTAEREAVALEMRQKSEATPQEAMIDGISSFMDNLWSQAKEANREPRRQMLDNLQRCKGEYSSTRLAKIKEATRGGSEAFVMLTETKARAAESWLLEILKSGGSFPFTIKPTPLADIPEHTHQQVMQEVADQIVQIGQQLITQVQTTGMPVNLDSVKAYLQDYKESAERAALQELREEAQERAKLAQDAIEDQLVEGGWSRSFADFIWYLVRCKAGILKGPVLRQSKREVWENGEYVYKDVIVPEVEAPSPFAIFPTKDTITPDNGSLFEVHKMSRQDIYDLIGVPNYSEEKIRVVLSEFDNGSLSSWLHIDDREAVERAEQEAKNLAFLKTNSIDALEFTGTIPGNLLVEWAAEAKVDISESTDPERQYQVNVWKIGRHVIKALINPDPMGRSNYYVSSWARVPGSFWGKGVPEMMKDIQDICNSLVRALQNNVAIASGPQVEINSDRVDDRAGLFPWKQWYATEAQINDTPAIRFYQPNMYAESLIGAYRFFAAIADDMTVPAYAHGDMSVGGAGNTSSGLSMLMGAASRSVKLVISNVDEDVIEPVVRAYYRYNMTYNDALPKGDVRIRANGALSLMQKEQDSMRYLEMLRTASNPILAPIFGQEGLREISAQWAKSMNIDTAKILPERPALSPDQFLSSVLGSGMDPSQMGGQIESGGTPPNPMMLDYAGNPQGAPDMQRRM